jgi:hypothetical protein
MAVTYQQANTILDEYFGKVIPTIPTNYYMGVSTTAIQNDGTGATEPTDVAYSRVLIPNTKVSFTNANNGSLTNAVEFEFPESQTSWGIITHFFLADAITGGNIKIFGQLTNSRTVETGTILVLEVGALQINLENIVS